MYGKGQLTRTNGKSYHGSFVDDKKHGYGVYQ